MLSPGQQFLSGALGMGPQPHWNPQYRQQQQYDAWQNQYRYGYYPPTYYLSATSDPSEEPKEPEELKAPLPPPPLKPEEESPSEFKQLANHEFHELLSEFARLTCLCTTLKSI